MKRSTVEARVERRLAAAPDQVFRAWLEPVAVRAWMAEALRMLGLAGDVRRVEIDGRTGGSFLFSDVRDGEVASHWGSYRRIEPPHTLQFSWFTSEEEARENLSLVTVRVKPTVSGSNVTIEHEMPERWREYVGQTEEAWGKMLQAIERMVGASEG